MTIAITTVHVIIVTLTLIHVIAITLDDVIVVAVTPLAHAIPVDVIVYIVHVHVSIMHIIHVALSMMVISIIIAVTSIMTPFSTSFFSAGSLSRVIPDWISYWVMMHGRNTRGIARGIARGKGGGYIGRKA